MIDYWEAIGRLAYDQDLMSKFKNVLPPAGQIARVTVRAKDASSTCLDIPEKNYKDVQDFFCPLLTEQHLSLFAAGELIWTFDTKESREMFDQMNKIIAKMTPNLHCPSTSYFIALGLAIVDAGHRREMVAKSRDQVLPRLSGSQREHIVNCFNHPGLRELSVRFDEIPWEQGCFVSESHRAEYRHPLALDAREQEAGKPAVATSWASTHA